MPACRLCLLATGLLLGLLLFTPLSATGTRAEKPGVCPQLEPITDCVKACILDNDCQDNYKCCQAGCGSVCSKPNGLSEGKLSRTATGTTTLSAGLARTSPLSRGQVSTKPPVVTKEGGNGEKQGTCPSVDFPKLGLCEDQCQMDSQCSGNMKCCRNGCGKMGCTTPKF
ncbi:WAP four-disulfide core domain 2, isoform CRA_a [Rattus norvegicus]|uniref:WAP four-disulfide core domain protein 2 n=2 Tax=Rattus norvegicus TaxID=10116 RepID=WFDC2_RAT|nr:WAP four-disulfide core domain protein 2 precursor [Rattus norvegicus]XP_038960328.1 WAP four-disulfide core domain protein 2 isoform X1 [Rattus norvegicus]Q8CHN3.1 RecName: Full=WAP four-disulfide core domain protein 2; AltName: Full=Epididymal secretory protein 4; Short=RE4; Flags: Precursor [Rattus norvegicus]EDL96511.1 WAP four-disulfide core domain 2, isoform CRA_a [Rattus norvegicus]CAD56201.1 epididymal secretory protein 4 [Rattus norvegicus]|eukprot:NP_775132.1 WAP four-disulfide core domain protein 2 precursor [Rattus norvegicus]